MNKTKKVENPYRDGSTYNKLFSRLQRLPVTREKLVVFARKNLRLRKSAAEASTAVVLSPRKKSKRGDCRGNISAAGHLYYIEKSENRKGDVVYAAHGRSKKMKPRERTIAA